MLITYSLHVADRPGVLNRVSSLLRRRNYNIDSLTVGHSDTPGVSRMTLVVDAHPEASHRIEANLYKLAHVLRVENLTDVASVDRMLALVKVGATVETRGQVMQLGEVFRARVVDVSVDSLILEITGTDEKIDGLIEILRPFGILEIARTGSLAMARGLKRGTMAAAETGASVADDPTMSYSV